MSSAYCSGHSQEPSQRHLQYLYRLQGSSRSKYVSPATTLPLALQDLHVRAGPTTLSPSHVLMERSLGQLQVPLQ